MNKQQLINKLTQKLNREEINYIDHCLKSKGVKFYEGETEYDQAQRSLALTEIKNNFPSQIKILKNVLYNIKQPNPLKISNVNKSAYKQPNYEIA